MRDSDTLSGLELRNNEHFIETPAAGEYVIRLSNQTPVDQLAVLSVDGINVVEALRVMFIQVPLDGVGRWGLSRHNGKLTPYVVGWQLVPIYARYRGTPVDLAVPKGGPTPINNGKGLFSL